MTAIQETVGEGLAAGCEGWRTSRRCTAPDGTRLPHPHPECLAALYRYELYLLENGFSR